MAIGKLALQVEYPLTLTTHSSAIGVMDKQTLLKPLSSLTSRNEKGDRKNGVELHERIASGDTGNGEKKELKQRDAMQYLGYSWSTWRKWQIL